jgi:hypothetical protein
MQRKTIVNVLMPVRSVARGSVPYLFFWAAVVASTAHRKRTALEGFGPIGAYTAQSKEEQAAAVGKREKYDMQAME